MEQLITANLQQRKNRALGYRLLICYLKKSNVELHDINARYWLTKIFDSSYSELLEYGDLIFTTLSLLILKLQSEVNLSKTFAFKYLPKLFEMLSHNGIYDSDNYTVAVLLTIKRCLIYYPKAIKTGRAVIEKVLIFLLDSSNSDVVRQSAECWLLLKNISGNSSIGMINCESLWRDYQLSLIQTIDNIINRAFKKPEEAFHSSFAHSFQNFILDGEKDPFKRPPILFRRICNLIELLKISLSKPLINKKYICTQQILGLIQNGLNARNHQSNNDRVDEIYFETFLPEMYTKLLELLEILIDICNTHLRMDFRIVLNILMDALEITKSPLEEGYQSRFGNVRLTFYRVVSLWCSTLKEGSHCEIISEAVLKEILIDLKHQRQNITIASIKRDKLNLGDIFLMLDSSIGNENYSSLRQHAYFCLQQLLSSSGHIIKSSILKDVYNTLLDISIQMHLKLTTKPSLCNFWDFRVEVYKLLIFLLRSRNNGCPAPVETIMNLMGVFRLCDNSTEFGLYEYFEDLEQMIHTYKSNIYFKQSYTDIQYLNAAYENVRSLISEKKQQSKICSLQSRNQLPTRLDSYCSSKVDLITINEQEFNGIGNDINSSNSPILFGDGFENTSQTITAKENEAIFTALNNEVRTQKDIVEEEEIEENQESNDIMVAELEATFVSELK